MIGVDTMEKIVDKKGLVKDIKKRFGNFYTVPQIEDIVEAEGSKYFNNSSVTYEYCLFGQWKIKSK